MYMMHTYIYTPCTCQKFKVMFYHIHENQTIKFEIKGHNISRVREQAKNTRVDVRGLMAY